MRRSPTGWPRTWRTRRYKCVDAQGKTVYQPQPCGGSGAQLQPKTAPQGTNANDTPAWRPRNSFEASFTGFVSAKRACDHFRPGFAARTDADYQRWRQRHAVQIRAIEGDPTYAKWRGNQPRLLESPSSFESAGECEKYADLIAVSGALPDAQRATPQQAWLASSRRSTPATSPICGGRRWAWSPTACGRSRTTDSPHCACTSRVPDRSTSRFRHRARHRPSAARRRRVA
jgi:hypothetical protein